ncbi:hypothetical protein PHIN7_13290 [Polynucleobacter sp. HIN7]|nr:hypothetical protein PHIN7_13290 [Polynucleobacter sp. HIN7]
MAPVTAPPKVKLAFAAAVVIDVLAARVTPVLLSPTLQALPLVKLPAKVMLLGAVAVIPPLKVKLSLAASPKTKVPVFAKVTLLVTEFVAPIKRTL